MKFRPGIGSADYTVKARKVREFLQRGDRVRVTVMFRGRETTRPELGRRVLDRLTAEMVDVATATAPNLAGRDMTMILTPKGRRDGGTGVREPRRPRPDQPSRVDRVSPVNAAIPDMTGFSARTDSTMRLNADASASTMSSCVP